MTNRSAAAGSRRAGRDPTPLLSRCAQRCDRARRSDQWGIPMTVDSGFPSGAGDIRPFRIDIAQAAVDDMNRRVAMTRWPDREFVQDRTQGVQLSTMQAVASHWATY